MIIPITTEMKRLKTHSGDWRRSRYFPSATTTTAIAKLMCLATAKQGSRLDPLPGALSTEVVWSERLRSEPAEGRVSPPNWIAGLSINFTLTKYEHSWNLNAHKRAVMLKVTLYDVYDARHPEARSQHGHRWWRSRAARSQRTKTCSGTLRLRPVKSCDALLSGTTLSHSCHEKSHVVAFIP